MEELFGLPPGERWHISTQGFRLVHPDDRARHQAVVEAGGREGKGWDSEFRIVRPRDGEVRWLEERTNATPDPATGKTTISGLVWDVTERRELTALAEAAERERISRELHDRVAHHMGVAHQSLELYRALREADPERAEVRLALARESARLALDQTRALSAELKRLQQEELAEGLEAAFLVLTESFVPNGVEVEFSFASEESSIPKPVEMQAYLAMREALRNAVRHSGCSRIGIRFEIRDGEIYGLVEDDGEGFDIEGVGKATPSWGVGLRSMRERAEMLGGSLQIDSMPGAGTRVEMIVPLDARRMHAGQQSPS
jgi:PAS domain S-box-containing protein